MSTLREAIRNGLLEARQTGTHPEAEVVEAFVVEFLSQKFQPAMLVNDGGSEAVLKELWAACVGDGENRKE